MDNVTRVGKVGLTSNILFVMRAAFLARKEFNASVGLSGDSRITALYSMWDVGYMVIMKVGGHSEQHTLTCKTSSKQLSECRWGPGEQNQAS